MPLVCPFRVRQGTSPKLLVTQRGARFMRSAAVQASHLSHKTRNTYHTKASHLSRFCVTPVTPFCEWTSSHPRHPHPFGDAFGLGQVCPHTCPFIYNLRDGVALDSVSLPLPFAYWWTWLSPISTRPTPRPDLPTPRQNTFSSMPFLLFRRRQGTSPSPFS